VRIPGILVVLALAASADAAPSADLVVVWAPGARLAPLEAVTRQLGAALIDSSPAPLGTTATAALVQRAIDAYDALRFPDAAALLEQARSEVDRSGAAGLTGAQLSDLFLYRGLVKTQLGDVTGAWDDLVQANVVDPTRVLDPARFEPRIIELFERARETVRQRARAHLDVRVPSGCATTVDGQPASGAVDDVVGSHWVRVTCPDRVPQGLRVELTAGALTLPVTPVPYQPPTDSELLVQARTASARALIFAEVHDQVAIARLIGLDGRERDRRTVVLRGTLDPLADAVRAMLAPTPRRHWYQSRWAWAAGAAAIAAAILVPVTAAIAGNAPPSTATVRPQGLPPW